MKNLTVLILCFCSFYSLASSSEIYKVTSLSHNACEFNIGWSGTHEAMKNKCIGSDFNGFVVTNVLFGARSCDRAGVRYSGGTGRNNNAFSFCKITQCPQGKQLNIDTGECEDPDASCSEMEGESLGTVTFPEGTRDVASICRNSCKATSDLFFPAANPPFGIFTYTGDSCDDSTGGGETGGGETGGGETGGGETG
ncbi:hypothetical protein, partial [Vibrio cyclitrophicus]|uniref:hypothetical protein n=1 Tax=Vibrio cyclitrophicus TaxID=47951 RepID=UPI0018E91EEE